MPPAGLLYGLVAAAGWGLTDITAAVVGSRVAPLVLTLGAQAVGLAIFAAALVGTGGALTGTAAPDAAMFGVTGALGYVSAFTALRIGPLAVVSPVIAASGPVVVVLSVVFRGEVLHPIDWLGVLLASTGVVLVAIVADGNARPRLAGRGALFALLANVAFAVTIVGLAAPIQTAGWAPVTVVSRAANVTTVASLLLVAVARRRVASAPSSAARRRSIAAGIVGVGVFDAVATISFSVGLETSETWLVGLASSFGPALAVVFAVRVLGERLRPVQWLGLAVLVLAVVVFALP